jgi:hypothetical protein
MTSNITYKWEVHDNENFPNKTILVNRHLKFDVRYNVVDDIITHTYYWFHKPQQIHPSVAQCNNSKYNGWLCHQLYEEFVWATDVYYIPGDNQRDPVIGKIVKISEHGFVSFCHRDGDDHKLNLNWKRLHNR